MPKAKSPQAEWFRYVPAIEVQGQNAHVGIVEPGESYLVAGPLVATFSASPDWEPGEAPE